MSLSLLLSVSTCVVVVRFETGKVFSWEVTVMPQSLVLSCYDVRNGCGGKKMYCWEMGMDI